MPPDYVVTSPCGESHQNAFDSLRVIAALAVLYSHSYALYGLPEPSPIAGQAYGSLAVAMFFSLSGYLVCQSWERDPHFLRFALRRTLRIVPGLIVVVAFTALLIGPIFTKLTIREYFQSGAVWQYLVSGSLALASPPLPGLFEANPSASGTNGSLWTLRYEFLMYLFLALLGTLFRKTRLRLACTLVLIPFAAAWIVLHVMGSPKVQVPFAWRLGTELYVDRVAYLGAFFFAGACAYLYRERIYLSRVIAALCVLALFFISSSAVVMVLLWIFVPYIVSVFAFKSPALMQKFNGYDYSYGIYIYAFPIQQAFVQVGLRQGWSWVAVFLASAVVTVLAAALSWYFVERPALSFKKYIKMRRVEPAVVAPLGSSEII